MYSSPQTPIDIHCSKLVDWLVQRRHCRKDWGENLATIRRKIRAALGDMPENEEIKQLLIGSKLDYFKSKRIIEILEMTEASSKNIFGYYSSQRMKDWKDVVYSYERDNIYLAEIATDLIRETNYEIPGIRKVIGKLNKEKEETEKERANLLRRAQQFTSEYQKMAQSYGITGQDVVLELEEKSKTLSTVMEEIVKCCKDIKPSLEYYREFSQSVTKQNPNQFLSMLEYIISNGNKTVYEWKYGVAPERIEIMEKPTSIAGQSNPSEIEIIDDEIDFGEDLPSSESSSGFVHVDKSDNGNGNIEETFIKLDDNVPQVCCKDVNDKVARGDDAKLVLEYRRSRNQFLNNLHELAAFCDELLNVSSNNTDNSNSFIVTGSTRCRQFDKNEISETISTVKQIIGIMNKERNKILFQMNDSPSFLETVKEKFALKRKQTTNCNIRADQLSDHIKDLDKQIIETAIHLKKSIVFAKELQEKVEIILQGLYKGRPINIMGCVMN